MKFHDKLPPNSSIIAGNVIPFSFINCTDLKSKNFITFKDKNLQDKRIDSDTMFTTTHDQ